MAHRTQRRFRSPVRGPQSGRQSNARPCPRVVGSPTNGVRLISRPFIDAGWRLVLFHQRGHGPATPVTDGADYDPVAMGGDLWASRGRGRHRSLLDRRGPDGCGNILPGVTPAAGTRRRFDPVRSPLRDELHPMIAMFDIGADTVASSGVEGLISLLQTMAEQRGAEPDPVRAETRCHNNQASLELALRNVPRWVMEDMPFALRDMPFPVVVFGWDKMTSSIHCRPPRRCAAAGVTLIEFGEPLPPERSHEVGVLLLEQIAAVCALELRPRH